MRDSLKLLVFNVGLITFLSMVLPSNANKYDMKSINEPVTYYDGLGPPPPMEKFEYLTYKDKKHLFLSENEKPLNTQATDCWDMTDPYDDKVNIWGLLEVGEGFTSHPEETREPVLDILAKLKVKSIWEGTKEEEEGKGCKLYKLRDDTTGKFVLEYVPCNENHLYLCVLCTI